MSLHQMLQAAAPHRNWLQVLQGAVGCGPKVTPLPFTDLPTQATIQSISSQKVRQWAETKSAELSSMIPPILQIGSNNTKIRQNVLIIYMQRHKEWMFEVCSFGLYSASELPDIVSHATRPVH